jgi:hypothetical protein
MDEVLSYLQQIDPLWAVVPVAIALAVLVVMRLWGSSLAYMFAGLIAFGLVGAIATAGYYGYVYFEDQRRLAERKALDERAEILFSKSIEPDSVFACIDGSPAPAMLAACERSLFAEPQRVAAAVAIVTQRLAFLTDALAFAAERDPAYERRVAAMRNSVESDPYGFVGFVLSVEHGCSHEACARFSLFRDDKRVRENMRSRRLEAYLAKYTNNWRGSSETVAEPAPVRTSSPIISVSPEATPAPRDAAAPAKQEPTPGEPAQTSKAVPQAPIVVDPPAAAMAPILTPPTGQTFSEPARAPEPAAKQAPAKGAAAPIKSEPKGEAKGEIKSEAKAEQKSAPRPATQAKSKAKSLDPVSRPSSEPVGGLPRVVPSEYIRDAQEKEEAAAPQPAPRAGAPTPISPPQQNFTRN